MGNEYGMGDAILKAGIVIHRYVEKSNEIVSKRAFDLDFNGFKFCAINQGEVNSEIVKSVARKDHDGILAFKYDDGKWRVSMYQNEKSDRKIDLSVIARSYGGGGHAGACGFEINDIQQVLNPTTLEMLDYVNDTRYLFTALAL